MNRARNDLSGKVIPLFKTYQDWEKKIIFEPFDQENLAGQPTILVRLNWPFFTPICQKAWQANYFIRAHRLKIHIKCSEFGFVARDESNGISWFAKFSNKKLTKKIFFFWKKSQFFFVLVRATILSGNLQNNIPRSNLKKKNFNFAQICVMAWKILTPTLSRG